MEIGDTVPQKPMPYKFRPVSVLMEEPSGGETPEWVAFEVQMLRIQRAWIDVSMSAMAQTGKCTWTIITYEL